MQPTEFLGRLLIARWNLLSQIGEMFTHRWIGQGLHNRAIELVYDRFGRGLRDPDRMPGRNIEPWQPGLICCRNVGRRRQALLGAHSIDFDATASHLWQGGRRTVEQHVDSSGYQVLRRRGIAAIGHELKACAGGDLEQCANGMRCAADAAMPH